MRSLANCFKELARRVMLCVANDRNAYAEPCRGTTFWHGLSGVIRALGMHIWSQKFQQRIDARLVEHDNVIHGAQGSNKLRAGQLGQDWASSPFQRRHTGVAVHTDHQEIAFTPCSFQISHVTYMKRVEAPVREYNSLPARPALRNKPLQVLARNKFGPGVAHPSGTRSGGFAADGLK
jgi:hypothetical protein